MPFHLSQNPLELKDLQQHHDEVTALGVRLRDFSARALKTHISTLARPNAQQG